MLPNARNVPGPSSKWEDKTQTDQEQRFAKYMTGKAAKMHKGTLGLNNKKAKSLTKKWVKDFKRQPTKEDKGMKRYCGLYVIGKIQIPKR